eukprot:TRINITY_DN5944_c0_g1_i3.p3 TRINITY_DN5944_c0_g1~~TRINITY_DN5944_c0_g1_i3.p3  ORF type:complete len:212 (-),score=27.02 TRINITY_DN5944_c0_g1_i3:131-766(-)
MERILSRSSIDLVSRPKYHSASPSRHRHKAVSRRIESLLRDPKGWPSEKAPLRVRAGVMSNLAAQRQADARGERVTMYRDGRWSNRKLEFSLRPPLAAAAVIAMIVSAAVHFMGGTEAWQPWADGLANRFYEVDGGNARFNGSSFANAGDQAPSMLPGQDEAAALRSDVDRFRAHLTGRIPMRETETRPSRDSRREPPPPSRRNGPDPASS